MGIRPSLSAVYEKDNKGVRKLIGYEASGPTASQKKAGTKPKDGFGVNTPKLKKAVVTKAAKIKDAKEKILKRKGIKKTSA